MFRVCYLFIYQLNVMYFWYRNNFYSLCKYKKKKTNKQSFFNAGILFLSHTLSVGTGGYSSTRRHPMGSSRAMRGAACSGGTSPLRDVAKPCLLPPPCCRDADGRTTDRCSVSQ